jgi:E3 ubiquitin-protein ligase BRE1
LETKFYAAMRDKESVEMERKNLSRHSEKQAKAVEHLVETERNLSAQIVSLSLFFSLRAVTMIVLAS